MDREEEEEGGGGGGEETEGRDMHRVPGIRDKVMSRHVGASGPKSRQALSVTFLNCKQFLHYCSCPTVRDCPAVYPTLLWSLP